MTSRASAKGCTIRQSESPPAMRTEDVPSSLFSLLLQVAGVGLLAVLTQLLGRSTRRDYLRRWANGWAWLTVALGALYLSFRLPVGRDFSSPSTTSAAMLSATNSSGAFGDTSGEPHRLAFPSPAALSGVALAVALPFAAETFTLRFVVHAAVLSLLFALGFRALRNATLGGRGGVGLRILQVATLCLSLEFLHYVFLFGAQALVGLNLPSYYAAYTSILDLLFETFLAFGMVIAVMQETQSELVHTNAELRLARDRLEVLSRLDPLTESLNRHAFYSLVGEAREDGVSPSGALAIIDIDGLKSINDRFGHAAGDLAIRAVSRAIRDLVRSDDLVFRWGGDEFLAVLFGLGAEEARQRLATVSERLRYTTLPGAPGPVAVQVSFGVAPFDAMSRLEKGIEAADAEMYEAKRGKN